MNQLKYYYVIMGSNWDLYLHCYKDINQMDEAVYISDERIVTNRLLRPLLSDKIRMNLILPFNQYLNKRLYRNAFPNDRPLCFIFFSNWVRYDRKIGLIDYLRSRFPQSKYVWFLQDLYKFVPYSTKQFDLVLSFDQGDVEKYNFIYHPLVFSNYYGDIVPMPESDVYFLGKAKNRLHEIFRAYELMKEEGLNVDMNIVDVPKKEQIYTNDIHYIEGLTYYENLQHLLHSKCALEIMQQGGKGFTIRYHEVIAMSKKLITNNPMVCNTSYFDKGYISHYDKPELMDRSFLRRISSGEKVDYGYNNNFSPIELIKFVDKLIQN